MSNKFSLILVGAMALSSIGCAHAAMRGGVAMKTSDTEAHVCLGDNEVNVGDRVFVFQNDCPGRKSTGPGQLPCQKVQTGEGTVTKLLNEHYSVVRFDPGVAFNEGTFVEKR